MNNTFLDNFKYIDLVNYRKLNENKGVYLIRNIINNNLYVGSTVAKNGFKGRLSKHMSNLKLNNHDNNFFQNSINKYGIDNFKITILLETKTLSNEKIREIEKEYIDYYGNFFTMFNLADPINFTISEYTKSKISKAGRTIKSATQGVYQRDNKFRAKIIRTVGDKYKQYILGTFNTLEEAKNCYEEHYKKDSSELEEFITKSMYEKLKNTKTGYFGVHHTQNILNPYFVCIQHNKNKIHLGVFPTAKLAAIAYNNYLLENNLVSLRRPLNILEVDNDIEHI